MVSIAETVAKILGAPSWDQRVAQIRLVGQRHGTGEHQDIYSQVAKEGYVPYLAPDFAYIHEADFYELPYFREVYAAAATLTVNFTFVTILGLSSALAADPRTLLVFRTILGLTKDEFAHSTQLAGELVNLPPISSSKVDSMERRGTGVTDDQAHVIAATITRVMDGSLFGRPGAGLRVKQDKPDTSNGWATVSDFANDRVPLETFLHQRHYGGAFRQVLDATSTRRGDLIEDAVEALFTEHGIPHIRTGAHNQAEIARRFEVQVTPAPDFVVHDSADRLQALLECKGTNNGGTARDKALRFERLRQESIRLNGVPLLAVLGGIGWTRTNDALGPVVRDTDGRVFTLANLSQMLDVAPFPSLIGLAPSPAGSAAT